MAFIRRVRTGSGATAVQIAEYANGRQRIVEHVGSAHTEAELGVLLARACELLEDPAQGALDLAVEPSVPVASILAAPADAALFDPSPVAAPGRAGPGKVVGTHSRLLFDVGCPMIPGHEFWVFQATSWGLLWRSRISCGVLYPSPE